MNKASNRKPSPQTQQEASRIAKSIQRPAQTKEQTKLITQGIQQGIDLYKKQQKEKARELNRKLKRISAQKPGTAVADEHETETLIVYRQHPLPWLLLAITWVGIAGYWLAQSA
jgi:tRNA C32,U32 (ribose-2'-O)-methylase TrmJ